MHSLSTALHIHVGNIGNLDLFGVFVLTPNHTGRLFTALPKSMIVHKSDFNATAQMLDHRITSDSFMLLCVTALVAHCDLICRVQQNAGKNSRNVFTTTLCKSCGA